MSNFICDFEFYQNHQKEFQLFNHNIHFSENEVSAQFNMALQLISHKSIMVYILFFLNLIFIFTDYLLLTLENVAFLFQSVTTERISQMRRLLPMYCFFFFLPYIYSSAHEIIKTSFTFPNSNANSMLDIWYDSKFGSQYTDRVLWVST